jgi:hypothetical protein
MDRAPLARREVRMRRVVRFSFLVAFAALVFPPSGRADTIVFKNGLRLECKVDAVTAEGLRILLGNEGKGSLVVELETVERIEYDYDSRLDALEGEDYTGHYALGAWAESNEMPTRALDRYLYAKGKPGVPPEVYVRIGRMFEKVDPPKPEEAYWAFRQYLEAAGGTTGPDAAPAAGGTDDPWLAEAEERAGRIYDALGESLLQASAQQMTAETGLETRAWSWPRWDNAGEAKTIAAAGKKRNLVLELDYKGGSHDKTPFALTLEKSLAEVKAIRMDIYNPNPQKVGLALAVITGEGYEWFESRGRVAAPGQWTLGLRFDLTREKWKSKASGWSHTVVPASLDRVRSIVILVYNGNATGTIYIDDIQFESLPE